MPVSVDEPNAATLPAPRSWVKSVSELRLPAEADRRLTELMDRNTEGKLSASDREELSSLVEVSEMLSLVRTDALILLNRRQR